MTGEAKQERSPVAWGRSPRRQEEDCSSRGTSPRDTLWRRRVKDKTKVNSKTKIEDSGRPLRVRSSLEQTVKGQGPHWRRSPGAGVFSRRSREGPRRRKGSPPVGRAGRRRPPVGVRRRIVTYGRGRRPSPTTKTTERGSRWRSTEGREGGRRRRTSSEDCARRSRLSRGEGGRRRRRRRESLSRPWRTIGPGSVRRGPFGKVSARSPHSQERGLGSQTNNRGSVMTNERRPVWPGKH